MIEIIFWIVCVLVVYRFNRDLHRDIFDNELQSN